MDKQLRRSQQLPPILYVPDFDGHLCCFDVLLARASDNTAVFHINDDEASATDSGCESYIMLVSE